MEKAFIVIQDLTPESRFLFVSATVTELLGWEPRDLVNRSSFSLVHPDEESAARNVYNDTVRRDKAAALTYLRLQHKLTGKYLLCVLSRSVVHNALIGSVSIASSSAAAMYKNSTAQEVTVLTPSAARFQVAKWSQPEQGFDPRRGSTFPTNPLLSSRTGLILNRFSRHCQILYCTNNQLLDPTAVYDRSIYDFVVKRDEDLVRSWIELAKGWGVEGGGQPSEGGFGYGKFSLCLHGRNSQNSSQSEPSSPHSSRRRSIQSTTSHSSAASLSNVEGPELLVEAIFSAHSDGLLVILRKA